MRDVAGTPRGCLAMNTASELGQSEPEIASTGLYEVRVDGKLLIHR